MAAVSCGDHAKVIDLPVGWRQIQRNQYGFARWFRDLRTPISQALF
jgi:hypothetical protein